MDLVLFIGFISICVAIGVISQKDKSQESKPTKPNMATFAETQLIGGERFMNAYGSALRSLHQNPDFMLFIMDLRKKINGAEFTETKSANRKIANEFFYKKANDKFQEVYSISQAVRKYGKQASAHISIYYAMYILDN